MKVHLSEGVHVEHVVKFRRFGFEVAHDLLVEVDTSSTERANCPLYFFRETEKQVVCIL